jgi:hypothetical protein
MVLRVHVFMESPEGNKPRETDTENVATQPAE